jgi:D-alanyl-D-alanine carboxypeptidase
MPAPSQPCTLAHIIRLTTPLAIALALAGAGWPGAAFAQPAAAPVAPATLTVVEGLIAALAAGDPEAFERFAQQSFAPSMLARRTPENRRQFLSQVHGDFGAMEVVEIVGAGPATVEARVRSANGQLQGTFRIEVEPGPPHHILGIGMDVSQGGNDAPQVAVPPVPPVAGVREPQALAAQLDPYLAALAADDRLSGTVLVAYDGEPLYDRSFGLADRAAGRANSAATRHNVASIGKKFTHLAIAQLIAQGKLSLDDTIGKHLPAYPNREAAEKATIAHLVDHRGGIADMFSLPPAPEVPRANRDWFAVVAPAPLSFPPGTQNRYCNGCYVVLGEIIAAVAGMPYEQYVAQHVFAPAGMTSTAFLGFGEGVTDQAMLYTRTPEGLRPPGFRQGMRGSGAGGVYATAADLLAFDNALRGYRLADRERTSWVLGAGGEEVRPGRAAGGMGIAGGSPGTSAVLDSDGRWTVVVLTNHDPRFGEDLGIALARALSR